MQLIQLADESILSFIQNNLRCGLFDFLMPLITAIGNGGVLYIILAVLLMVFKKTRKYGIMLGMALAFGFIFGNLLLKNIVARPRPFSLDCELLIKAPADFSFPSGHTMASFETAYVLWYMNRKIGAVMIITASLVAFSRLYLNVHYPTDIIAGLLLGTFFGYSAVKLYNMREGKRTNIK